MRAVFILTASTCQPGKLAGGGIGRAAAARLAALRTPSEQTRASAERFGW